MTVCGSWDVASFEYFLTIKSNLPDNTAWYPDTETWLNTLPIMQHGYPSGFHQKHHFIYSYLSGSVAHKWKHFCIVGANGACAGAEKLTSCLALRHPPSRVVKSFNLVVLLNLPWSCHDGVMPFSWQREFQPCLWLFNVNYWNGVNITTGRPSVTRERGAKVCLSRFAF